MGEEKARLPGTQKNGAMCGGPHKFHFSLPIRTTERDHASVIGGYLCEDPAVFPFGGGEQWQQTKFRLLVMRKEPPIDCIALFNIGKWISATLHKGDYVLCSGWMRYYLFEMQRAKQPVFQVNAAITMPAETGEGFDLASVIKRLTDIENRLAVISEQYAGVKEQMDAYGIKVEKKRDWREGAEEGSLW